MENPSQKGPKKVTMDLYGPPSKAIDYTEFLAAGLGNRVNNEVGIGWAYRGPQDPTSHGNDHLGIETNGFMVFPHFSEAQTIIYIYIYIHIYR